MTKARSITIVGGGLAGLTLGIGLRQRGIAVTVHEAGHYPRHRVCGEFISGRGQETLERLELRARLEQAGAVLAHSVAFFSRNRAGMPRPLPVAGLCLSRFVVDDLLASRLRELGGELIEGERINVLEPGQVRATGRRLGGSGETWLGLKIHARQVVLEADLELHVLPRGYVGLCRINDGEVNVCGLFRRGVDARRRWELLRGEHGSPLDERLATADWIEESFCAVAGISLQPGQAATHDDLCIGDAITMIPPFTGNGMSMAFESAELAVAPLAAWSRGQGSWDDTRQAVAAACDEAFARRLRWAHRLQAAILTGSLQNLLLVAANHSGWFRRMAFELTR